MPRHEAGLGKPPPYFSRISKAWVKPSCLLYPSEPASGWQEQHNGGLGVVDELVCQVCGREQGRRSINYFYYCVYYSMRVTRLEPSRLGACALALQTHSFHYQSWWSCEALFPLLGKLHGGGKVTVSGAFCFPRSNSWRLRRHHLSQVSERPQSRTQHLCRILLSLDLTVMYIKPRNYTQHYEPGSPERMF